MRQKSKNRILLTTLSNVQKHNTEENEELERVQYFITQITAKNKKSASCNITPLEIAQFLIKRNYSVNIIIDAFKKESIPIPPSLEDGVQGTNSKFVIGDIDDTKETCNAPSPIQIAITETMHTLIKNAIESNASKSGLISKIMEFEAGTINVVSEDMYLNKCSHEHIQ